ncbi:MAG: LCP family protein [Arcanobacterium sp.]|nr:LCP family protein [Arcanobacterium sp.]MDY5589209.1 LCP family protein [Arcanobacterium sp.]
MAHPPSFKPNNPARRPSARGAQRVGHRADSTEALAQNASQQPGLHSQPRSTGRERQAAVPNAATAQPPSFSPRTPRQTNSSAPGVTPMRHQPTGTYRYSNSAHLRENSPSYPPSRAAAPSRAASVRSAAGRPPQSLGQPRIITNSSAYPPSRAARSNARRRPGRKVFTALVLLLVLIFLWGGYLYFYGNGQLTRVAALSNAPGTPGTTYLIVGSDQRAANSPDPTEGMRSDTIMLLHKPTIGKPALVSIPRDSWVEIPGNGHHKINSAFAWGGPKLLVQTVEALTGLTVDHYVQIGMDGVKDLTDAVGGVQLCLTDKALSFPISDPESGLIWAKPGCETVNGEKALAFSRMRKADPQGDLGRTARQRQVVGAILRKAISPALFINPLQQKQLVGATARVLTVDTHDSLIAVGTAGFTLRSVMGPDGLLGAPPISSLDYEVNGESAVQLDPDRIKGFWDKLRDGALTANDFYHPGA